MHIYNKRIPMNHLIGISNFLSPNLLLLNNYSSIDFKLKWYILKIDAMLSVVESTKSGALISGGLHRRDVCWKTRAPMIRTSGPFKKPLDIIEQPDNAVNSAIQQRVQNGSTRPAFLSSRRLDESKVTWYNLNFVRLYNRTAARIINIPSPTLSIQFL